MTKPLQRKHEKNYTRKNKLKDKEPQERTPRHQERILKTIEIRIPLQI
jgi:hypothetical protein